VKDERKMRDLVPVVLFAVDCAYSFVIGMCLLAVVSVQIKSDQGLYNIIAAVGMLD